MPDPIAWLNCLPRPAILLDLDYRIVAANDRYRERYGFSDRTGGRHCYEVSHRNSVPCDLAGEACPLKQSLESGEPARVLHVHHTPRGEEYVNVEMWPVKDPATGRVECFVEQMHPSDAASVTSRLDRPVGQSPPFRAMMNLVERVAGHEANVLLLGESGTGKEMIAQTIHRLSDRRDAPFVPVECTGLPVALFESELFGYVKGAFTGASAPRSGLVAAAHGGTLFLDEIGDIPIPDQVKLLRLLETRRYRPVGSNEWREADFRLICATNRDLDQMVEEGRFREDLYYRLNVFDIELPPLRERIMDLDVLIATILERLGSSARFSEAAMAHLRGYPFPGNVRELRNIVERAVILADDGMVGPQHLPARCRTSSSPAPDDEIVTLEEAERRYLAAALASHDGDRKSLAERLGISERVLYRKLAALR